ncbi:hypothetical protein A7K61_22145 [Pseudomonas sp. AP42]|nr:hypothetical protein A7K61_22145 [Pseudomonas sp. AP42]
MRERPAYVGSMVKVTTAHTCVIQMAIRYMSFIVEICKFGTFWLVRDVCGSAVLAAALPGAS